MSTINSRPVVYETYVDKKRKSNKGERLETKLNTKQTNLDRKVTTNKSLPVNEKTSQKKMESSQNSKSSLELDSVKRISKLFERENSNKVSSLKNDTKINNFFRDQNDSATNGSLIFGTIKAFQSKIKTDKSKIGFERKVVSKHDTMKNTLTNMNSVKLPLEDIQVIPSEEKEKGTTEISRPIETNSGYKKSNDWPKIKVDIAYKAEDKKSVNDERLIETNPKKENWNSENKVYNGIANGMHQDSKGKEGTTDPIKEKLLQNENSNNVKLMIMTFQKNIEKEKVKSKKKDVNKIEPTKERKSSIDTINRLIVREKKVKNIELIYKENDTFSDDNKITINDKGKLNTNTSTEGNKIKEDDTYLNEGHINNNGTDDPKLEVPTSSIKELLKKIQSSNDNHSTPAITNTKTNRIFKPEEPKIESIVTENKSEIQNELKVLSANRMKSNFKQELEKRLSKVVPEDEAPKNNPPPPKSILKKNNTELSFENELKHYIINRNNGAVNSQPSKAESEEDDSNVYSYKIGKKSKEEVMTDWVTVNTVEVKTKEEIMREKEIEEEKQRKKVNKVIQPIKAEYNFKIEIKNNEINSTDETISKSKQNHPSNTSKYQYLDNETMKGNNEPKNNNNNNNLQNFISKHIEKSENKNKNKDNSDFPSSFQTDTRIKSGATRIRKTVRPDIPSDFKLKNSEVSLDVPPPDYD